MNKKPKPAGLGHYTVCRECQGTGLLFKDKSANNRRKNATAVENCRFCIDGTGKSRGWVPAER